MSQWNCQLVVPGWNLLSGLKQLSVSISEYRLHINYISTVINVWGQIYKKRAGLRATERPTPVSRFV